MSIIVDYPKKNIPRISFNRAEKCNVLDNKMIDDLHQILDKISKQNNKLLILTASGKHFCAGADLFWMKRMAIGDAECNEEDAVKFAELYYKLAIFPAPILAMAKGKVFGGGAGIIAVSDMAIATEDTEFSFPETGIGLVPFVVSPWIISAIGRRRAQYYFLSGKKFSANEALSFGLIHQVVKHNELELAGEEFIKIISKKNTSALKKTKTCVREFESRIFDKQVYIKTGKYLADIRKTPDALEGIDSFLEKRKPTWDDYNNGDA